MADPAPVTPPQAQGGLLGPAKGLLGLLGNLVDRTKPQSTKRALALLGGITLCLCAYALTLGVLWQAASRGTVDSQLVFALLGALSSVGLLAGISYRKPEPQTQALPEGVASPQAGDLA